MPGVQCRAQVATFSAPAFHGTHCFRHWVRHDGQHKRRSHFSLLIPFPVIRTCASVAHYLLSSLAWTAALGAIRYSSQPKSGSLAILARIARFSPWMSTDWGAAVGEPGTDIGGRDRGPSCGSGGVQGGSGAGLEPPGFGMSLLNACSIGAKSGE